MRPLTRTTPGSGSFSTISGPRSHHLAATRPVRSLIIIFRNGSPLRLVPSWTLLMTNTPSARSPGFISLK